MPQFRNLACWIALLWSGLTFAQTPALRWCLDNFPGFHEFPNDYQAPKGPSVELMQELARRVNAKLLISARTPTTRCFRQMQQGEADVMSNLNYTEQRAEFMRLIAYRKRIPEAVLQRGSDTRTITSIQDLKLLTLVSVRGYSYHPELMRALAQHPAAAKTEVSSIADGLVMLQKGRVDAMLTPGLAALELIEAEPQFHYQFRRAKLAPGFAKTQYIYIGISKRSPAIALGAQIEQALHTMDQDGTITRLYFQAEHSGGVQYLATPVPESSR